MEDNDDQFTPGDTEPESKECVKEQQITDHFKIMINKARRAQKMVLIKRADDLLSWGAQEEVDFSNIFGVKGNKIIKVRKYGQDSGKRMPARFLMIDGVRRLMILANDLAIDNYKDFTKCNEYAAFVSPGMDVPYIINIGGNFEYRQGRKQSISGKESQVATLCHEMSHLQWYYKDNNKGGMWTQDYISLKEFATSRANEISYEAHVQVANVLFRSGNDQIFENAYNIERYFEVKFDDNAIDASNDDALSSEVSKKILELENMLKTLNK
ncbi:peptidase M35 [Salmonella enterica]|nr:peptidase M35 [Salmonella enterica]ECI4986127.1 peptidase M35 [Salmonella enterica subsp. salamae]EHJ5092577.1 peptidase M35 [Salmonella enterica subsp. salamae serovar 16:m,t:-]HCM1995683.1 peptidase M35 [Salmonella enterica subsp. salamae serovar 53:z4,z24:-]EBK3136937.1 peptidase M35 [Salmonella enterica]